MLKTAAGKHIGGDVRGSMGGALMGLVACVCVCGGGSRRSMFS